MCHRFTSPQVTCVFHCFRMDCMWKGKSPLAQARGLEWKGWKSKRKGLNGHNIWKVWTKYPNTHAHIYLHTHIDIRVDTQANTNIDINTDIEWTWVDSILLSHVLHDLHLLPKRSLWIQQLGFLSRSFLGDRLSIPPRKPNEGLPALKFLDSN